MRSTYIVANTIYFMFKVNTMNNISQRFKRAAILILSTLIVAASGLYPWNTGSPLAEKEEFRKPIIAVLGSSLAAGWVTSREAKFDMQNGWAFRLERLLSDRGFKTVNIAKPGDTTQKALDRLDKELFPLKPDFVIISLSLENEGIRGIQGKIPEQVYKEFQSNLRSIIRSCREHNIVPIVASCYPSDNYTEDRHYQYIKNMNLKLAGWDVPGINLLGALDNGRGGFVEGVTFDLDHPNSRGHAELFYSVVPSLFKALLQGFPLPSIQKGSDGFALKETRHPAPLSFIPEDPIHSFTVAVEVRPKSSGILASIQNEIGDFSKLYWKAEDKKLIYESRSGKRIPLSNQFQKGKDWHHITLSHGFLKEETLIFVDGQLKAAIEEKILPVHMVLGGAGSRAEALNPLTADFRNWMVYRSSLNGEEAEAIAEGKLLQPSLELYVPLSGESGDIPHILKNRAQSTSQASAFPQFWKDSITDLREKIAAQDRAEKIFVDPDARKSIAVDPKALDELIGDFTVDENLVLTVAKEKDRFFLLFNGGDMGKQELFPLSPCRFFMRIVGPEADVDFLRDKRGRINEIKLTIGPNTIIGKKQ